MSSLRSAAHRALLLPVLAAWLAAPPLGAQSAAAEAAPAAGDQGSREAWELPRTAWGDPDLRGTWSYASLTPLERPGQFRDREFFSPEEASARNEAAHAERPHVPGVIGSYNAHWFDKGRGLKRLGGSSWGFADKQLFKIWGGDGAKPDTSSHTFGFRLVWKPNNTKKSNDPGR